MIEIAVVDFHPIVRRGIRKIISDYKDMRVLAESSNIDELLEFLEKNKFQIIKLDIILLGESGYMEIGKLLKLYPDAKIIIFSEMSHEIYAEKCLEAGARGYVSKGVSADELYEVIKEIAEGEVYTSKV